MTPVLEAFRQLCEEDGNVSAVIDDRGFRWTRAELHRQAERVAERLVGLGVRTGDTVLISMPNRIEWMAAYLGTLSAGAVPGTLPITHDATAIAQTMSKVGAEVLLLSTRHRDRDFAAGLPALSERLGGRLCALLFGERPGDISEVTMPGERMPHVRLPNGTAHILFSSSTTGESKAIAHSEASLGAYNSGIIDRYGVDGSGSIFMPSPLGHSTGVWHGVRLSLLTGSTLVVQDRWDPVRALQLVEEHRCSFTVAATPFLQDLVHCSWEGPPKFRHMDTFLCGGAQVPPILLERAADSMPQTFVASVWAMSEGGATCSLPSDPPDLVTGTCGPPLPGVELRTIDDDGQTNGPGLVGELVMRTPSLCLGYVQQDAMFAGCFTPDGFFRTGDQAVIDADGYLRIVGRVKDLIIRGGINIGPVPIEDALRAHPDIQEVAVIGLPDERLGERICAVVVTSSGKDLQLEGLTPWLATTDLPKRWWPEAVVTVPALPMTPAGKVQKHVLVTGLERARAAVEDPYSPELRVSQQR